MNIVNMSEGTGSVVSRNYHHGALAEAMVDEALTRVRALGADQVSLRSIASALEVSPSAAYNHFSDKDDLLRAVGGRGLEALDERMAAALADFPDDTDDAARARFSALGRAYLDFAIHDLHLFQLTFGPICMAKDLPPHESGPYVKLTHALDDLDHRGMLKLGIRPGLDLTVWAATHGMATLLVEGMVPTEAVDGFMASMSSLIMG